MMRPLPFFLLVGMLLTGLSAPAQTDVASITRLKAQLQQSKPDSNRIRVFLSLSEAYREKAFDIRYFDSTLHYAKQAVALSRSLKNRYLLGESLLAQSQALEADQESRFRDEEKILLDEARQIYPRTTDPLQWANATLLYAGTYSSSDTARIPHLQSALAVFRELGNRSKTAQTLADLAETDRLIGKYRQSLRTYLDVLAIHEAIQDKRLSSTLYAITFLYRTLGDYPRALQYGYRLHRLAKQSKDLKQLGKPYFSLATIYGDLGDTKAKLQYMYAELQIAQQRNNLQSIVRTRLSLSRTLLSLGRNQEALQQAKTAWKLTQTHVHKFSLNATMTLARCYTALGDYPKAEGLYLNVVPNYLGASGNGIIEVYEELGSLYLKMHRLSEADSYLHKALKLIKQFNNPLIHRDVVLKLYQLDSIRGNYRSALDSYRLYTALNDSLVNEAKNKQIAALRIQFDTDKKEQDIKFLQQERKLNQASVENAQTARNVTIGGAVMLSFLLVLSYNRYRLKQRSNQQLEAKQLLINLKNETLQQVLSEKEALLEEKEWMLREIHHRVKNNLQVISSMLNSQYAFLNDPTALAAIRESQNRVHAMALIHQKLYQSDSLALVDMKAYIQAIVEYLIGSFDRQDSVQPQLDLVAVQFDVTLATPLGLIINEVVTNALKYAFPKNRSGKLTIELCLVESEVYRLTIGDDGIGFPASFDSKKSKTLGLTLIRGLSKQINGQLSIGYDNGVQISLQFREAKNQAKTAQVSA